MQKPPRVNPRRLSHVRLCSPPPALTIPEAFANTTLSARPIVRARESIMSENIVKSGGAARSHIGRSALAGWLARLTPAQAVLLIIAVSAAVRLIGTNQLGIESDSTYS